jgi:4-hydroxy-tetrahydrodipicolinate synthase
MYTPSGAFAPVPTPLNTGVDEDAIKAHLGWLSSEGLDGALILGTNGEFASLSLPERREAAVMAATHRAGLKLLLNVGSCALPEALELTGLAAEEGYDAILLPPPWYWRNAGVAGLAAWFRAVLDASRLPVLLYHIPQVTGVPISDELLQAIGPHENLVGVKDSTGDPAELQRLLPQCKSYLVGHDKLVAACKEAGGHGSISACASVVPDLVKLIERKPEAQAKLNSVRGMLEKFGLLAATKAVLRRQGFGAYKTRPPQVGLEPAQEQQLFAMLDMLGVIKHP